MTAAAQPRCSRQALRSWQENSLEKHQRHARVYHELAGAMVHQPTGNVSRLPMRSAVGTGSGRYRSIENKALTPADIFVYFTTPGLPRRHARLCLGTLHFLDYDAVVEARAL